MSLPDDVPFNDGYVSEDEEDGLSISTTGTDVEADHRPERLFPPETCRVIFDQKTHQRVCGNPRATCRRKGHRKKDPNVPVGLPGYYRELPGLKAKSFPDGDASTFRDAVEVDMEIAAAKAANKELIDEAMDSPAFKNMPGARTKQKAATEGSPDSGTSTDFIKVDTTVAPDDVLARMMALNKPGAAISLQEPFAAEAATVSRFRKDAKEFIPAGSIHTVKEKTESHSNPTSMVPPPSALKAKAKYSSFAPDPMSQGEPELKPQPTSGGKDMGEQYIMKLVAEALAGERSQLAQLEKRFSMMEKAKNDLLQERLLEAEAAKQTALEKERKLRLKVERELATLQDRQRKTQSDQTSLPTQATRPDSGSTEGSLKDLGKMLEEMNQLLKSQRQAEPTLTDTTEARTPDTLPIAGAKETHKTTDNDPPPLATETYRPPHLIKYPTGPDTSTGEKEAFGVDVTVAPQKLLQELCPTGIPQDAMQALGEALPDTGAMPGTYALSTGSTDASTETETFANQMGMMLSHLNAGNQGTKGMLAYGVQMDSQWSSASRTQLRVDMSESKFDNLYESFGDMEDEYRTMFKDTVTGILSYLPWLDGDMMTMYVEAGRLYQVFNHGMGYYRRLLDYIDKVRRDVSWTYASLVLNHYGRKFHVIRNGSTRRITMIMRTYCVLRNGAAVNWMTLSLQGKVLKSQAKIGAGHDDGSAHSAPNTTPTQPLCDHCHGKHLGGAARCPFKRAKVPATESRRLVQTVTGPQGTKAWLSRAFKVAKEYLEGLVAAAATEEKKEGKETFRRCGRVTKIQEPLTNSCVLCDFHADGPSSSLSSHDLISHDCGSRGRYAILEEDKQVESNDPLEFTYGTYLGGANLIPATWHTAKHRFEVTDGNEPPSPFDDRPSAEEYTGTQEETPTSIFDQHPVDVFVADHSKSPTPREVDPLPDWYSWLATTPLQSRPKIIVQVWPSYLLSQTAGPMGKIQRKTLERAGYSIRYKYMDATRYGSSVSQQRLVVFGFIDGTTPPGGPDEWLIPHANVNPRPMANCLRPYVGGTRKASHIPSKENVANATSDPMPPKAFSWICDQHDHVRRLYPDELAKGIGVPKSWLPEDTRRLKATHVDRMTSSHLWEAIGLDLAQRLHEQHTGVHVESVDPAESDANIPQSDPQQEVPVTTVNEESHEDWSWTVPDLRPHKAWYRRRWCNLKRATKSYPPEDREEMLREGKLDLQRHRNNYGPEGAQYLQLLWWEFPKEHWDSLRVGCSMNFLRDPKTQLTDNSTADDSQMEAAIAFVEELIALGVLELAPDDDPIAANAPLFVLPKPGQPGQWRVLANMKDGGQNEAIGSDPVYLPRVDTILPHMYTGGWSAVVDASKYFYQFPTVISERKFLGMIHPSTGLHYRYRGLPMGSANSPAVAGRLGAAFLRKLTEKYPEYQGKPVSNTWLTQFDTGEHDDKIGAGRVLIGDEDGLGAALVWAHVDDFFIHAPTREKLVRALNLFMNLTVEVGMLCNPTKVVPPSQRVKYCGFEYDSVGIPTLFVPDAKISKSLAIIDYLESKRDREIPRLILAIAIGVLQSLVDATPSRRGQTFLRHLNDKLHESDEILEAQAVYNPKLKYYLKVVLDDGCWDDLKWWKTALHQNICRPVRPKFSGTLLTTWGDGSGTGTGGTTELIKTNLATPMEMWMGTWEPQVNHFSSNWRELCTLHLTLQRELSKSHHRCRDATMFYFTDNEVTYHIINSGSSTRPHLHRLIVEIKLMELQLGCHLVVIHVPGVLMCCQGTDGLSRGVWISPLQERIPTRQLLSRILAPVKLLEGWKSWFMTKYDLPTTPDTPIEWTDSWSSALVFHRFSTWIPPPEMASQAISFLMNTWVEQPWTSSALIIVPRILTRAWQFLSRSIQTLEVLQVGDCPFIQHPVPIVVLHLAPHVRSLPTPTESRLDSFTLPDFDRISAEATLLRGLS